MRSLYDTIKGCLPHRGEPTADNTEAVWDRLVKGYTMRSKSGKEVKRIEKTTKDISTFVKPIDEDVLRQIPGFSPVTEVAGKAVEDVKYYLEVSVLEKSLEDCTKNMLNHPIEFQIVGYGTQTDKKNNNKSPCTIPIYGLLPNSNNRVYTQQRFMNVDELNTLKDIFNQNLKNFVDNSSLHELIVLKRIYMLEEILNGLNEFTEKAKLFILMEQQLGKYLQ